MVELGDAMIISHGPGSRQAANQDRSPVRARLERSLPRETPAACIPRSAWSFKREAQEALLSYVRDGGLRVPVERELPFENLPEGLEALASGAAAGKWVLSL